MYGCARKRTHVQPPTGQIDPTVKVGDLPTVRETPDKKDPVFAPWYHALYKRDAQPVVQPSGAELVEVIDLDDPAAINRYWNSTAKLGDAPTVGLLTEILNGVMDSRPKDAKWSLLRLELVAKAPQKPQTLRVNATLVLHDLYLRRPLIEFDRVRLEECLTRMVTQAGIRHVQKRAHNPVISWRSENVSLLEAIDAILDKYGFTRNITGVSSQVVIRVIGDKETNTKYQSRGEFVAEAIKAIKKAGDEMERDVPTLIVEPKVRADNASKKRK